MSRNTTNGNLIKIDAHRIRQTTHEHAIVCTARTAIAAVIIAAVASLCNTTPFGAPASLTALALFVALTVWVPVWTGRCMAKRYGDLPGETPQYGYLYVLSEAMYRSVAYEYWIVSYIVVSFALFMSIACLYIL